MAAYDLQPGRLHVRGSLDIFNSDTFYKLSRQLLRHNAEGLVLDLRGVNYISSECIGVISALWVDVCEAGKKLRIVPSHPVRKIFVLAGFDKIFDMQSTPEDIQQLRGGRTRAP